MIAKVLSYKEDYNRQDDCSAYYMFFKLEDGRSARMFLSSKASGQKARNYDKWKSIMRSLDANEEVFLDNIIIKEHNKGLVVSPDSPVKLFDHRRTEEDMIKKIFLSFYCNKCDRYFSVSVKETRVEELHAKYKKKRFMCEHCKKALLVVDKV